METLRDTRKWLLLLALCKGYSSQSLVDTMSFLACAVTLTNLRFTRHTVRVTHHHTKPRRHNVFLSLRGNPHQYTIYSAHCKGYSSQSLVDTHNVFLSLRGNPHQFTIYSVLINEFVSKNASDIAFLYCRRNSAKFPISSTYAH